MADRPFLDQSNKPTDETLGATLGPAYDCWRAVIELAKAFASEWTYTRSCGWVLKIHDRRKALVYLIPLDRGFKMSMAIRGSEREAFLLDPALALAHDAIASARRYPEGFAVAFAVDGGWTFGPAELFIGKLIAARA
jgi:hypothetical protein